MFARCLRGAGSRATRLAVYHSISLIFSRFACAGCSQSCRLVGEESASWHGDRSEYSITHPAPRNAPRYTSPLPRGLQKASVPACARWCSCRLRVSAPSCVRAALFSPEPCSAKWRRRASRTRCATSGTQYASSRSPSSQTSPTHTLTRSPTRCWTRQQASQFPATACLWCR